MNGWCSALQRPSVSLHSNIGGSTIQSALWRPSGTRSKRRASSRRSSPSAVAATSGLSATISSRSPGLPPSARVTSSRSCVGEELGRRRAPGAVLLHERPHQPAGAEALGVLGQRVQLGARQLARPGVEAADDAAGAEHVLEDLELRAPQRVADVGHLQAEAHVGLVGAVAQHRLGERHPRPRRRRAPRSRRPRTRGAIRPSISSMTSSSSTKDISMSSWVNSGWRKPRRSSSRKQRAIW